MPGLLHTQPEDIDFDSSKAYQAQEEEGVKFVGLGSGSAGQKVLTGSQV